MIRRPGDSFLFPLSPFPFPLYFPLDLAATGRLWPNRVCPPTLPSTTNMAAHWSQELHRLVKRQNIRQVSFVPDGGQTAVIKLCEADSKVCAGRLTTAQDVIAHAGGAWSCGRTSVYG